jgi:hypothetical protein
MITVKPLKRLRTGVTFSSYDTSFFFEHPKLLQVVVFTNALKLNMFCLSSFGLRFNNTFVFQFHYNLAEAGLMTHFYMLIFAPQ